MKGGRLTRFSEAKIPKLAGQKSDLSHIGGENPRKGKFTEAPGTNPVKMAKRVSVGMSQSTAPQKHETSLFSGKFGFGGPGTTDPI
jgi:hypothetical protein